MDIVMEFAENGEMFGYLQKTGPFQEKIARFYFKQLINTLEYIHSQGIAHRDIKTENTLLDENFNLKLADFGLATNANQKSFNLCGTAGYLPPECHLRMGYKTE